MNLGRLIGLTALVTALTACGGDVTLTYSVTSRIPDTAKSFEVFEAAERVMTRRLPAADVKDSQVKVVPSGSGAIMTIKVPSGKAAGVAERILAEPFTFDVRLEGPKLPDMGPDETNWLMTGVDGSTLLWVVPITNPDTKEIGVELQFSEKGHELLQKAFEGNNGKHVGIFVRDLLVSKMTISTETVTAHILISGIPSERVAQIFADDVNVGLHAIFTEK